MPKYKAICIDLDQTIANTEDYQYSSDNKDKYRDTAEWHLYQYLKPHLKVISWQTFIDVYQLSKNQVKEILKGKAASHSRYLYIQKVLENLNCRFRPDLVYDATNIYWNYILSNMQLFPEVLTTLQAIKREGITIMVVTDLTADIQILKLKKLNINQYIDYLVTSEEADADKPNPQVGTLISKKLGINREDILMIGNNPKTDIQLAHNIKMDSVLFDFYSKYPPAERNNPTFYTTNFKDILIFMDIKERTYTDQKLVVFDMIGTLTTDPRLISHVFLSTFPNMDRDLVKKHYKEYKVNNIDRETFWKNIGITDFEEAEKKFLNKIELRNGIIELLIQMKQKHKLAILSNISKEWGAFLSNKYGFKNIFDEIVFSGDYHVKKPDYQIYKILVDKFPEISPENVFFVDDDLEDLKSGKDFLMKTIWIKSDQVSTNYIPDYVIDHISEVNNIVT
ncbi:MAG: HAD family hydrolase [Candidatus Dojkabacteria bacterium]|jgi:HAD superfamily hydrolase (TIGR01509 family)